MSAELGDCTLLEAVFEVFEVVGLVGSMSQDVLCSERLFVDFRRLKSDHVHACRKA